MRKTTTMPTVTTTDTLQCVELCLLSLLVGDLAQRRSEAGFADAALTLRGLSAKLDRMANAAAREAR